MHKLLKEVGLRKVTVDVAFSHTLEKHLASNEEICGDCGGLGLAVDKNCFGIQGIKSNSMFPFKKETLSLCQSCYNGVRKRCEHCDGLLPRGYNDCTCETARENKLHRELEEREQHWKLLPKIPLETALKDCGMLYIDDYDEYVSSSSFYEWIEMKLEEDDMFDTLKLHIYITAIEKIELSASSIVENALDELHEQADVSNDEMDQLQNYLDQWCEKNKQNTISYYADLSKGVSLANDRRHKIIVLKEGMA